MSLYDLITKLKCLMPANKLALYYYYILCSYAKSYRIYVYLIYIVFVDSVLLCKYLFRNMLHKILLIAVLYKEQCTFLLK